MPRKTHLKIPHGAVPMVRLSAGIVAPSITRTAGPCRERHRPVRHGDPVVSLSCPRAAAFGWTVWGDSGVRGKRGWRLHSTRSYPCFALGMGPQHPWEWPAGPGGGGSASLSHLIQTRPLFISPRVSPGPPYQALICPRAFTCAAAHILEALPPPLSPSHSSAQMSPLQIPSSTTLTCTNYMCHFLVSGFICAHIV